MEKKMLLLCIFVMHACGFGSYSEKSALGVCQLNNFKKYVEPSQFVVTSEGIFIFLEDLNLKAESIFYDGKEFYYLKDGVTWICGECGALNDLDDYSCYKCHSPR